MPVDLQDAETELYGAALEEFVDRRTELAKAARNAGDSQLAKRIQAMRKPTMAAWLANQLPRARESALDALLDLGQGLREASAALDGARLRELNPRRRVMVEQLVEQARGLATERGVKVSNDIADRLYETLDAALVDATAGAAVQAGRLTHALQHNGFGIVDETGEPADVVSLSEVREKRRAREAAAQQATEPAPTVTPTKEESAEAVRRRERAEQKLAETQGVLDEAEAHVAELETSLTDSDAELVRLDEVKRRLTAELEAADEDRRQVQRDRRAAKRELDNAARAVRDARRRRDVARAGVDELD